MSRVFEGFNPTSKCPICNTNDDKQAILVPIIGTEKGGCCQAAQIHLECVLEGLVVQPAPHEEGKDVVFAWLNHKINVAEEESDERSE